MAMETIDPTTYPISRVTAEVLQRPLFGHVIDGGTVPSADGATMPVIDPASGAQIATAAAGSPADAAVSSVEYFAGWPSKVEGTIPAVPAEFAVYAVREPIGVVGLITPWNGPTFTLAFVAGALAAGNCVVMKPAEQTPMAAVGKMLGAAFVEEMTQVKSVWMKVGT